MTDKLTTMLGAFAPLATVFHAGFDDDDRSSSYTRFELFLPAARDEGDTWENESSS